MRTPIGLKRDIRAQELRLQRRKAQVRVQWHTLGSALNDRLTSPRALLISAGSGFALCMLTGGKPGSAVRNTAARMGPIWRLVATPLMSYVLRRTLGG